MSLNASPPELVEVLIVGAGPAGIAAAHSLSQAGIKTLMVDARYKMGHPLRCAEMTRREYLDYFGVDAQPGWIKNQSNNLSLYVTNFNADRKVVSETLYPVDYSWIILDREKSEYEAPRILAQRGVFVIEACSVNAVGPWDKGMREVVLSAGGKTFTIKAKLVIAADGPSSMISRMVGLSKPLSLGEVISYYGYEIHLSTRVDPSRCDVFMYPELAPFYFWIFPGSENQINVGLGVHGYRGHMAKLLLDKIVAEFPWAVGAEIQKHIVAWTPTSGPLSPPIADGVIVVGGAARLTGAVSGEGLWAAVVSGNSAARCYMENRDRLTSADNLKKYELYVADIYMKQREEIEMRKKIEALIRKPSSG